MDETIAKNVVIHTLIGSGEMLLDDPNPNAQVKRVSSPNGTTQAGLEMMDQLEFDHVINKVLTSAYERAIELSKET